MSKKEEQQKNKKKENNLNLEEKNKELTKEIEKLKKILNEQKEEADKEKTIEEEIDKEETIEEEIDKEETIEEEIDKEEIIEEEIDKEEIDKEETIEEEIKNKITIEDYAEANSAKFDNQIKKKKTKTVSTKEVKKPLYKRIRYFLIKIFFLLSLIILFLLFFNGDRRTLNKETEKMNIFKEVTLTTPLKEYIKNPTLTNEEALDTYPGEMIGYVFIPEIDMKAPVYQPAEKTNKSVEKVINQSLGHDAQTLLPGEKGNTVITGHREEQFSSLEHIKKEDVIIVNILDNIYLYEIEDIQIVPEDEEASLDYIYNKFDENNEEELTLYTDYPFIKFSQISERYVVKAKKISQYNKEIKVNDDGLK